MDKLETLQERINNAFLRIEAATRPGAATPETGHAELHAISEANVLLAAEVDALKAKRLQEASELDRLIQRLKPLVSEVENA